MAATAPPTASTAAPAGGLALPTSNGSAATNGVSSSSSSHAANSATASAPSKASRIASSSSAAASASLPVAAPGIYPSDSVRMAAESIGLGNLDESVAVGLAGDVEFRLHQVIEEARKFMRHSRRTTMTPADINHALSALSIEPIYGHLPLPSSTPHFLPLKLPPSIATSAANATGQKSKSAAPSSTAALAAGQSGSSSSGGGDIYFLSDPEVDFARLLAAPPPGLAGGGVRWRAHWLAVEGVMPRVPENVAPDYQAFRAAGPTANGGSQQAAAAAYLVNGSTAALGAVGGPTAAVGKGAKPALSQELQLYFSRLTAALLPSVEARAINASTAAAAAAAAAASAAAAADSSATPGEAAGAASAIASASAVVAELSEAERARLAALASLRGDTGLQGLVVYLVRWLGEKVAANLAHLAELSSLLEAVNALIANQTLFLEPFLHQILPIILSPLLTSPLGGGPPPVPPQGKALAPEPTMTDVRQLAAEVLGVLVREFGSVYETLVPRLTKTLLRSLAPPHPAGRVQGALLGLGALGRHAVWRALWGGEADAGASSRKGLEATAGGRSSKRLKSKKKDGRPGAVRGPERLRAWTEGWASNASWPEDDRATVIAAAFSVLPKLLTSHRPSSASASAAVSDSAVRAALTSAFGPALGGLLASDKWLAKRLLELSPDEQPAPPAGENTEVAGSSAGATPAPAPASAGPQLDSPATTTGEPAPAPSAEAASRDGKQESPPPLTAETSAAPATIGEEDIQMDEDAPTPKPEPEATTAPAEPAAPAPASGAALIMAPVESVAPEGALAPVPAAEESAAADSTPAEAAEGGDDDDDEEMEAVP